MNKFWKYILNKNLALLAFLLMLLSSCSSIIHQQSSKIVKVDSIVTIESDTTVALFSSYENPNCHLRFKLDVPVKAYSQKTVEAAELMIITLINEKYIHETSSLEEVMRLYTKEYIFNYLKNGINSQTESEDDQTDPEEWMNYEERFRGKVLFNDKNIFSYSLRNFSFSGGAHENITNNVSSLDLKTNKIITLDYLFTDENLKKIHDLIIENLNKKFQLLTDEIDVVPNFYLSDEGITFVYNPLDIAAYSDGELKTTLSWNVVEPLLKYNPIN